MLAFVFYVQYAIINTKRVKPMVGLFLLKYLEERSPTRQHRRSSRSLALLYYADKIFSIDMK